MAGETYRARVLGPAPGFKYVVSTEDRPGFDRPFAVREIAKVGQEIELADREHFEAGVEAGFLEPLGALPEGFEPPAEDQIQAVGIPQDEYTEPPAKARDQILVGHEPAIPHGEYTDPPVEETSQVPEPPPSLRAAGVPEEAPDVVSMRADEAVAAIEAMDDLDQLAEVDSAEAAGRDRKTVREAVSRRVEELEVAEAEGEG